MMKKITIDSIKNALTQCRTGSGKAHIVVAKEDIKCWITVNGASNEPVRSNEVDHIFYTHSRDSLLNSPVAVGNKTGTTYGDLTETINDNLIEKGYKSED